MIPKGKIHTFIFTQKPPWLSRSKPLKYLIDRFENVHGFVKMFLSANNWQFNIQFNIVSSGHFNPNALKALIEYAYTRTITRLDHL